jgi:hypothetical protein
VPSSSPSSSPDSPASVIVAGALAVSVTAVAIDSVPTPYSLVICAQYGLAANAVRKPVYFATSGSSAK